MTVDSDAILAAIMEVPAAKLCDCGCGKPAGVYVKTDRSQKRVKGEPRRFLTGHKPLIPIEIRFWKKVDLSGPVPSHVPHLGNCWIWVGACDERKRNYGRFGLGRRSDGISLSHRFSWQLAYGLPPSELDVCHHCDNDRCVRPSHLFLGTRKDNMQDCAKKGRTRRGERSAVAVLTNAQAVKIRKLHALGEYSHADLGRKFGVHSHVVFNVVHRRTYK